ncbi:MAG: hypothetical protein QM709_13510 [Spongiibacteraceae bacterium]
MMLTIEHLSTRSRLASFIYLLLLSAFSQHTLATSLTISDFDPDPNYILNKDSDDKNQLTDGKVETEPMWIKKGSVGWQFKTPIRINVSAINPAKHSTLKLHMGCGTSADVYFPRRIDIYTQSPGGNWQYLDTIRTATEKNCRRSEWVSANLKNVTSKLALIVHAEGAYTQLDEIELNPTTDTSPLAPAPLSVRNMATNQVSTADNTDTSTSASTPSQPVIADTDIVKDSLARLKASLTNQTSDLSDAPQTQTQLSLWIEDPWGELNGYTKPAQSVSSLKIQGTQWEHDNRLIGIYAPANLKGDYKITLSDTLPSNSFTLFEATPVLAANGAQIYDALIPFKENTISLSGSRYHYLWIKIDLSQIPNSQVLGSIRIASVSQPTIQSEIPISIKKYTVNKTSFLAAVNWGYSTDLPIWKNKTKVLQELYAGGINLHVIRPSMIPNNQLNGYWDPKLITNFWNEVVTLRQYGKILLFTNWNETLLPEREAEESSKKIGEVKNWLKWIQTGMDQRGIKNDEWALYVRDEPRTNLNQLIKLLAIIKKYNPAIKVYENPDTSKPTDYLPLKQLSDLSDYWQPGLENSKSSMMMAIRGDKSLWFYQNPDSPAKAASPLESYRKLAWWALKLNIGGIGFWSFSDTTNSSAWDDFDGERPDWAAVYESRDSDDIISSRRWEGFKKGIEDYHLLKSTNYNTSSLPDIGTLKASDMEDIRASILNKMN